MPLVPPGVIALASGCSAYLCSSRLRAERSRSIALVVFLTLWAVFLIVPVHLVAGLQMAHVVQKITNAEIAEVELVITIVVAAIWFAIPRPSTVPSTQTVLQRWAPPVYLIVCACVASASYLLGAINLCTSFPQGSDAQTYHLPLAVRWLQEGSLQLPASGAWQFSLTGNGEILMMLALSTGKQCLAPIFSWASCALVAICLFVMSRIIARCTREHAIVVVLIALSVPIVLFQTFSAYVDLFGTTCVLSAVALFLTRYSSGELQEMPSGQPGRQARKRLSISILAISALAAGLSLGTKPIYYVYCGLFFLIVLMTLWRERRTHGVPFARLAGLLVLGMLLPSSFWFVRGWLEAGNPVYPLQVKVGKHVILPGFAPSEITTEKHEMNFVDSQAEWAVYLWTEWVRKPGSFPSSYNEVSGAGGAFATFVPLGIAFTFFNLRKEYRASPALFLLFLACMGLLVVWFEILHKLPRFGLPLWLMACIFVAPLFKLIEDYYPKTIRALLVISVTSTFAICSLVPLHSLVNRIVKGRWSRSGFYAYPAIIDDLPPGSRVLNYTSFTEQNFPLAGKNLSNQLVPSFEAPSVLTANYLSSQHIDYVVEAAPDSDRAEAELPQLPDPTSAIVLDESRTGGKIWRIYRVVR